ncbi:helix-turn-helix domain-containing protein [Streptomyces sp. ISL-10]|uniref:helix-turn-helix domain-containing protein n=1 Tax=Streptomyces sp. ISL-10 TaxID=2819172 RepID=UPI001BE76736|nr:helix-turn-helix domain-containing protein [Streptomyces sp. ISL-10]MBT2365921.1 helix-turn-helix domain-containing protein [Streptomyces sp. ISL-10]
MASEFGEVLRRLRVQAGMTQEELERRSGVSVRTIRGLETGKRPNPRMTTVQELAKALPLRPKEREELLSAAVPRNADDGRPGEPTDEPATGRPDPRQQASEEPAPAPPDAPTEPAEQLAKQVAARWRREEEQRQVQDPFPLPVRWRTAPETLTDHWANILRLPARATADPLDLDGQLHEVTDTYRRIPSGRLVVLGRSGSGKTILALRFVLDHLKSRSPQEPVPVIFSIGAWNPTTITLRDWLTAQLTRDHPGYAARGPGRESLASALVESGRILPVLDGFDEMADGLRRPALEALNATTLPLLLTSRPAEYAAAVAETDVLTSAAAIELTDLTVDDLADYLPRTTRKTGRANPSANAWDPVLTELREQSQEQSTSPLATVLTTPLMVALARTIYSDTPDHDPASLLDTKRFGSPEKLEDHLLDNFIPTVYRHRLHRSSAGRPHRGFDPERARHWLGYLAHHLTRLKTPDLAWWRLGNGMRRSTRTLVTALVTGLAIGLVDGTVSAAFHGSFTGATVDGMLVGFLAGLMFGLVHWFTYSVKGKHVRPSAVRLRIRGRPGPITWTTGPRLVIGTLGGAIFGFAYGFVVGMVHAYAWKAGLSTGLHIAIVDGTVYGLVFGAGAGLTFCLLGLLETPLDLDSAVNPRSLLNTNRGTVITQLLVWAPAFGAVVGFGSEAAVDLLQGPLGPLVWPPDASLVLGIISGLGAALGYALTLTAWGQWLVLTRIWLPLTGRLPWAVTTFLEDAYQRGVLRQAGAVYQFRHARLQHHLAHAHRTLHAPGRPGRRSERPQRLGFHDDFIAPP